MKIVPVGVAYHATLVNERKTHMSIYVIADLHLSFKNPKPMNIFGDNWENHEQKIKEDWLKKVRDDDLVVLPR